MFTLAPKNPLFRGRAIVSQIIEMGPGEDSLFEVHTDFGHVSRLSASELREIYEIDRPMSFQVWKADRLALIQGEPSAYELTQRSSLCNDLDDLARHVDYILNTLEDSKNHKALKDLVQVHGRMTLTLIQRIKGAYA